MKTSMMRNVFSLPTKRVLSSALAGVCFATLPLVLAQTAGANPLDNSQYENVFWRDRPISMHLETGVERLIRFPSPVQVGIPPDMMGLVQVESASNVVYITAHTDFEAVRFRFRELASGKIYLFNVSASPDGHSSLVQVIDGRTSNDEVSVAAESNPASEQANYGYHTLSRFAFQSVYAPERLIKGLQGVREYSIKSKKPLRHLIPGEAVAAVPWKQWRSPDGLYVTAVYLTNLSGVSVALDPRHMRHSKDALFTSLMTDHLAPRDALGDSTAMVVISGKPWEDSVQWLR